MLATTSSVIKKTSIALIAVIFLFTAYWISNHSRIKISVLDNSAGKNTVILTDATTGKVKKLSSDSSEIITVVPRGNYQVSVTNSKGSFVSFVASTPRFLGVYTVEASLKKQSKREFVGDSPKNCMGYTGSLLVSEDCGGLFSNLQAHIPASSQLTSYTIKNSNRLYGEQTTLLNIGNQLFAVTKTLVPGADIDSASSTPYEYTLVSFNNSFAIDNKVKLQGLDGDVDYIFKPDGENGFIAYRNTLNQILNYSSSGALIAKVQPAKPSKESVVPVGVYYVGNNSYAVLYNSAGSDKNILSELVVKNGSATSHYMFKDTIYSNVILCGTNKACLLSDTGELDVQDLSTNKPKRVFSVPNVSDIESIYESGAVIVVTGDSVLHLDPDKMTGYVEYSLGGYHFNNISKYSHAYLLSLTDSKNRTSALLVEPNAPDTDSIDKKVGDLRKSAEISFVSIYGKYIYIHADLGAPVYNRALGEYADNPQTKKSVAEKINHKIDELKIDRTKYVITSNAF